MSSRGKSRSYIKLTNFPQQVIMLDNDYIHTFSTMSSLKNSKQTYSQTFWNKTSIKTTPRFYWWKRKSKFHPCLESHQKKNKCIRHYTEIKTSCLPAYFRTLLKEFCKNTVFQSDCIRNSNTYVITRKHLRVFKLKKRRFLSLDMNISLKQHKDTYGFHKGDLVEQTRST